MPVIGVFYSRRIVTEYYTAENALGIKIAHLSDMHFPYQSDSFDALLPTLADFSPDIVVVTGDAFDARAEKNDLAALSSFFSRLTSLYKVYAVIGNHEIGSPLLEDYVEVCKNNAITLLNDEFVILPFGKSKVLIAGVKDGRLPTEKNIPGITDAANASDFRVLLAHRPEKINSYAEQGFDVAFCGHAHGGQIRFFGKGLYSPDQGFFPRYTSGVYRYKNTTMLLSRGLGDRNCELRIFNPYHIILATI